MKNIVIRPNDLTTYESRTPDHRRFQLLCEKELTGSKNLAAGIVVLPPGQCQPGSAYHSDTEELYYVLKGKGKILIDEKVVHKIEEGVLIYIPFNTGHRLYNTQENEELRIFWANTPCMGDREGYKPIREKEEWKIYQP